MIVLPLIESPVHVLVEPYELADLDDLSFSPLRKWDLMRHWQAVELLKQPDSVGGYAGQVGMSRQGVVHSLSSYLIGEVVGNQLVYNNAGRKILMLQGNERFVQEYEKDYIKYHLVYFRQYFGDIPLHRPVAIFARHGTGEIRYQDGPVIPGHLISLDSSGEDNKQKEIPKKEAISLVREALKDDLGIQDKINDWINKIELVYMMDRKTRHLGLFWTLKIPRLPTMCSSEIFANAWTREVREWKPIVKDAEFEC